MAVALVRPDGEVDSIAASAGYLLEDADSRADAIRILDAGGHLVYVDTAVARRVFGEQLAVTVREASVTRSAG